VEKADLVQRLLASGAVQLVFDRALDEVAARAHGAVADLSRQAAAPAAPVAATAGENYAASSAVARSASDDYAAAAGEAAAAVEETTEVTAEEDPLSAASRTGVADGSMPQQQTGASSVADADAITTQESLL
jgi:hypothetical protein